MARMEIPTKPEHRLPGFLPAFVDDLEKFVDYFG